MDIKTTLVNINRGSRCDVYIGRGGPFGNPFVIGDEKDGKDGTREDVIRKFRDYFQQRLKMDLEFRKKVESLRGKVLGCYCRPQNGFQGQLLCHGQIIAGYLDKIPPESIS